jgi:hypothetical protein
MAYVWGEEQENLDVYFDLLPQRRLCYHVPTFLLRPVGRWQPQPQRNNNKNKASKQAAENPVAR